MLPDIIKKNHLSQFNWNDWTQNVSLAGLDTKYYIRLCLKAITVDHWIIRNLLAKENDMEDGLEHSAREKHTSNLWSADLFGFSISSKV